MEKNLTYEQIILWFYGTEALEEVKELDLKYKERKKNNGKKEYKNKYEEAINFLMFVQNKEQGEAIDRDIYLNMI